MTSRTRKLAKRSAAALALAVPAAAMAGELPQNQAQSPWFTDADAMLQSKLNAPAPATKAKNMILFVGDGMGISTVTAARIFAGQEAGNPGEENFLSFERFPHTALVKPYNTNQQTPDSAGTMTAMIAGVKTKAGVIGLGPSTIRGNCGSSYGQELVSALVLAEESGRSTGVVTTARLTHATPAATYAFSPERDWEDDGDLPAEAVERGCKDIARQLIEFSHGDGIEVAMGGGRRHFLPNTSTDPEDSGSRCNRLDGVDLTAAWTEGREDAAYVWNQSQFDNTDPATTNHLLGLFERSHMEYEADRESDAGGEPSLTEMTTKALEILKRNDQGFFLVVESGRIDHAHNAGNAHRALIETVEFANAIEATLAAVDTSETLVMVTADHSHVFTIAGYSPRGNNILGLADSVGSDGLPYTTLGYTNGPGYGQFGEPVRLEGGRVDLTSIDTTTMDFRQEAVVPRYRGTHAGEDIGVWGIGPGAHLLQGVIEQNVIFHVMNRAGDLGATPY